MGALWRASKKEALWVVTWVNILWRFNRGGAL